MGDFLDDYKKIFTISGCFVGVLGFSLFKWNQVKLEIGIAGIGLADEVTTFIDMLTKLLKKISCYTFNNFASFSIIFPKSGIISNFSPSFYD